MSLLKKNQEFEFDPEEKSEIIEELSGRLCFDKKKLHVFDSLCSED